MLRLKRIVLVTSLLIATNLSAGGGGADNECICTQGNREATLFHVGTTRTKLKYYTLPPEVWQQSMDSDHLPRVPWENCEVLRKKLDEFGLCDADDLSELFLLISSN